METIFAKMPDRSLTGSLKWEKYAGREILPMWVADMDLPSSPAIIEALAARARHGVFGYTVPTAGVETAVRDYLARAHDLTVGADELVWFPGLVPALNTAARAFAGPGEAILTCTPVYPPFLTAPEYQDRDLVAVPLQPDAGGVYRFDFEAMAAAITPATRVFYLCNPHNPVGRVFDEGELRALLAFCAEHHLTIISDEIHCDLLLDPSLRHRPTLGFEEARDRTVALFAPSKTYNIAGLSCSFAVVPDRRLRARLKQAMRGMITEVNCMGYTACEAAYREGGPWLDELLPLLQQNYFRIRAFVGEQMPQIRMTPMEATYLAWFDVRALGLDDPIAHFEAHGLGLSEGRFFGAPGFVRMNFGCPASTLDEGLRRFESGYRAAVG